MAFDVDPQSPIFTLQPDHRAQLFNAIGKTRWSFKDLVMGVGLADRKFPNFDRQAVHVSVARRFAEPANALPERTAYRPGSLSFLSDALTEMAQAFAADKTKAVEKLAQSGDARALQVPKSVKRYIIKPGDTIESIARTEMGSGDDAGILEVHNRNVGLLFEDGLLYAGSCLEIPVYDKSVPLGETLQPQQLCAKDGGET